MGRKGDVTRWLQNKKHRTPLEERVLALNKQTTSSVQTNGMRMGDVQCFKRSATKAEYSGVVNRSRSGGNVHEQMDGVSNSRSFARDIGTDLSEDQALSQTISSEHLISHESPVDHLTSVLNEYLKHHRIRLLDLFRCVDVSRSGRCSRHDFCYVLEHAKVPLTQAQAEQLAESLAVDDCPECANYSLLAIAMNRQSEMKLFRKRRADAEVAGQSDISQLSSSLVNGGGSDTVQSVCLDVTGTEKVVYENQKLTYCKRVMKLFRDNALFGEVDAKKTSSPRRRDDVLALKSTLNDDDGLATRMEQLRLRDRIDYEASRDAVRRHRLPVQGRALRRGLLTAADRPRSLIDVRRMPSSHMLAGNKRNRHRQTHVQTHSDRKDSLVGEVEEDDRQRSAADNTPGIASASSSWLGLRVKSTASTKSLHSPTLQPGEIRKEEDAEEEDGQDGDDRWSTRATGRPKVQHNAELRRMLWETDEEQARRHAVYWPGRADHVRVYHVEGERGGHAIFDRVGQTWYNDDPRYMVGRPDIINRFHCRIASLLQQQQQQQPRSTWQKIVEYGVVGPSAVYHCVLSTDGRR